MISNKPNLEIIYLRLVLYLIGFRYALFGVRLLQKPWMEDFQMFRRAIYGFLIIPAALIFSSAQACTSDFQCGTGRVCVKASNSVGVEGICVTPTDQFGTRQYNTPAPSAGPHEVSSCQFNTDCSIGFSCVKTSGNINGICVR